MKPSWTVVAKSELLRLVRDRRALFLAVVLPALLYPLLFLGMDKLEQVGERTLEARELTAVLALGALPDELERDLGQALEQLENIEFEARELAPLEGLAELGPEAPPEDRNALAAHIAEQLDQRFAESPTGDGPPDLTVLARPGEEGRPEVWLLYDGGNEGSLEARGRVSEVLDERIEESRRAALELNLGRDPADDYRVTTIDAAAPEDAAGAALGRLLPLIAVLVMVSGGAFAALDVFAAERENGTLETLLVQPVPASTLALGKFAAVLLVAVVAWAGNSISLLGTAAAGLLPDAAGAAGQFDLGLIGRVALGALLFLPSAVLIAVALCLVSSRARSFREGQNYLFPVTLAGVALVAPTTNASVELDVVLACVPLLGPSLAMRDALAGDLAAVPALIAVLVSLGTAALMVTRLAGTLDAERLLAEKPLASERRGNRAIASRALGYGLAATLAVYLIGGRLQAMQLLPGLIATLWIVVLGLALALAWANSRDGKGRLSTELALERLSPLASLGALLAVPALVQAMLQLFELQNRFLPLPSGGSVVDSSFAALLDSPLWLLVFAIAISPGICEEALFRGSVLSGLLREGSRTRAVLVQAALFALVHASIHRFAITFTLGLALGGLRLSSRSLVPCVLLHAGYNATQVLLGSEDYGERTAAVVEGPWVWLGLALGLGLIAADARAGRGRSTDDS